MSKDHICNYIYCLASALKHVHARNYIHRYLAILITRDVKPSNFLYNVTLSTGILIDFGLAQQKPSLNDVKNYYKSIKTTSKITTGMKGILVNDTRFLEISYRRPSIRASRAGTRGFRAPEVLLKVSCQTDGANYVLTVAIDMWSVGVIVLCIFTRQFPFFQSNDDTDALIELAQVFGLDKMKAIAKKFGKDLE
jgi:cell division control protein 7